MRRISLKTQRKYHWCHWCHWVIKHGNCVFWERTSANGGVFPFGNSLIAGCPELLIWIVPSLWQCWSVSVGSQHAIFSTYKTSHGIEVESTIPNQHKHRPPESLDVLWKVSSEPSFHRVYVSWKTVFRGWRFYPVTKMLLLQQPQGTVWWTYSQPIMFPHIMYYNYTILYNKYLIDI